MSLKLTAVSGVGPSTATALQTKNIDSVKKLSKVKINELIRIPGVGKASGLKMIQSAKDLLAATKSDKKDKKKRAKKKEKGKKDKHKRKKEKNKKGKNKKEKNKKRKK